MTEVLIIGCLILVVAVFFVATLLAKLPEPAARAAKIQKIATTTQDSMGHALLSGLSLQWRILYEDGKGDKTERDITVKAFVGRKRPYYVLALCHLRGEDRHFAFNRMIVAVDKLTGRQIESPSSYADDFWQEANGKLPAGTTTKRHLTTLHETRQIEEPILIGIRYEGADFRVTAQEHGLTYGRPYLRGRAHRPRREDVRAWTGNKTFYLDQPHSLFNPDTGESIADLADWLRGAQPTPLHLPPDPAAQ